MDSFIKPVEQEKAYRLFNLGATSIVTAQHGGVSDAMCATWVCPLDLVPFKATAVIDKSHFTRPLMEKSGLFALQLPTVGIARQAFAAGSISRNDDPDKLEKTGLKFFTAPGFENVPLVEGCACWAIFRIIPRPDNEKDFDLFIGECLGAWADSRCFEGGHWKLDASNEALHPLHYVAGAHFYTVSKSLSLE